MRAADHQIHACEYPHNWSLPPLSRTFHRKSRPVRRPCNHIHRHQLHSNPPCFFFSLPGFSGSCFPHWCLDNIPIGLFAPLRPPCQSKFSVRARSKPQEWVLPLVCAHLRLFFSASFPGSSCDIRPGSFADPLDCKFRSYSNFPPKP